MHRQRVHEPAVAVRKPEHHAATVSQSTAASGSPESKLNWSEGRRRFLRLHQERYLQRLAVLRDALLRDKDLVHFSLPKNCDRSTGFWEAIMEDMNEVSPNQRFPTTKSQRPYQSSVGGSLISDQNRRGHLERLRRIRIMQMRRRLPPQLEPLHGIGLGSKREQKAKDNKSAFRIPPTTYHTDWMKGNHIITPIGDREQAISSWTLKHLRTIDAEPPNEVANSFPNDIRTLLRRTRHSARPVSAIRSDQETQQRAAKTATPDRTQSSTVRKSPLPKPSPVEDKRLSFERSTSHSRIQSVPPPVPVSSPTPQSPFMSELISHHSSSSSRENSNRGDQLADEPVTKEEAVAELVDKATSPVGFRLAPLERENRASISSSANSKKQIVVKIPHGVR